MGIRGITERVLAQLEQGRSRKEIYEQLTGEAPAEAVKIAYCIGSVPENALRRKYLTFNGALFLLLLIYGVLTFITGMPVEPGEPTIFIVLTSAIPFVFAYFVFRFHGGVYRLSGIWFLIDLLETVLLVGAPDGLAALRLLVLFFVVVLSFRVGRKVFPHLGVLGPKKDETGEYLL